MGLVRRAGVLRFAVLLLAGTACAQSRSYFVDCSASASGTGETGSAWNTLSAVNAHAFVAGDVILFRRGTSCPGTLEPSGSGSPDVPIRIDGYGRGPRAKIIPPAGAKFGAHWHDQQWWEIADLDIRGGNPYGVLITADSAVLHHIILRNIEVHDVAGIASGKASGAVVVTATNDGAAFEDLTIDGVQAHGTQQWSGIFVRGNTGSTPTRNVTVRNSIVHDVAGDGIVIFGLRDGVIEHSVAYRTGLAVSDKVGTPNAIWAWSCARCVVQDNEAFLTDSPGIDGGAFDVDWANTGNAVRRNYGHDTQGYCVALFAALGETRDSKVNDNLCVANGLSPRLAMRQGAAFFMTWDKGTVRDAEVARNRIFWNPPCACVALKTGDAWDATNVRITGNAITSTAANLASPELQLQGGNEFVRLSASPTGNEEQLRGSFFDPARPLAHAGTLTLALPDLRSDASRAALVMLVSMVSQYRSLGLKATLSVHASADTLDSLREDWHFHELGIVVAKQEQDVSAAEFTLAIPGREPRRWSSPQGFRELGLALREAFGTPVFSQLP